MSSSGNQHCAIIVSALHFRSLFLMLEYEYIFRINTRKQRYQTALGNCRGLKLPKYGLQFKKKNIVSFIIIILIFIHRKFGSDTETQQRKHEYKQDTIQHTTIKSVTVVDTWYWSINKISYIIIFVYRAWIMHYSLLQNWQKPFTVEMYRNYRRTFVPYF